ncbi:DUF2141 domain-containing protein [Sulfuricurvum sp.]|uniref:DUF2141 domain-containing protein n=1 Tax=Sulfuricurvum sp. TaxID=2025608 RepID=UPI003BB77940
MKKILVSVVISVGSLLGGEINIDITNIKSTCGILKIGLYDSSSAFAIVGKAFRHIQSKETIAKHYKFENISNGTYAIALFCDENKNGKFDTNVLGIPQEAYGFSNNPKVFGKPNFEEASFELQNNKNLKIEINP